MTGWLALTESSKWGPIKGLKAPFSHFGVKWAPNIKKVTQVAPGIHSWLSQEQPRMSLKTETKDAEGKNHENSPFWERDCFQISDQRIKISCR